MNLQWDFVKYQSHTISIRTWLPCLGNLTKWQPVIGWVTTWSLDKNIRWESISLSWITAMKYLKFLVNSGAMAWKQWQKMEPEKLSWVTHMPKLRGTETMGEERRLVSGGKTLKPVKKTRDSETGRERRSKPIGCSKGWGWGHQNPILQVQERGWEADPRTSWRFLVLV